MFKISRGKKKTARAVFNQKYGIHFSYTVEASFASFMSKEREVVSFERKLYEEMGENIINVTYEFLKMIEEEKRVYDERKRMK